MRGAYSTLLKCLMKSCNEADILRHLAPQGIPPFEDL